MNKKVFDKYATPRVSNKQMAYRQKRMVSTLIVDGKHRSIYGPGMGRIQHQMGIHDSQMLAQWMKHPTMRRWMAHKIAEIERRSR